MAASMRLSACRVVKIIAEVMVAVFLAISPPLHSATSSTPASGAPSASPSDPRGPARAAEAAAVIAPASSGAKVELFSPEGTVKGVRQVSVRFSDSMVALGDPRLEDPFEVDCPAPGKGRWADGRYWVYDFDADLSGGVRCRFTLKKNERTLAGLGLKGNRVYSFDTGGPAVIASYPQEGWQAVDEEQIFLLKLDAPATAESIQDRVHCIVEGIAERIPVELLTGAERSAVLQQRSELGYQYFQLLWKDGQVSQARIRDRTLEQAEADIALLRCRRRLPPATQLQLRWEAGVTSASGIETTTDQQLAFRVRPAFTAQVECTRANARAGCMPMQPINVNFSAPVRRELALAIRLKGARGLAFKPDAGSLQGRPTVDSVSFAGPFPEDSALTAVLPDKLVDDAGRALENAERFPLQVRVDEYPPLAKFSGDFGILEAREGGVLPVSLRNVEPGSAGRRTALPGKILRLDGNPAAIADWLRRVHEAGAPSGEWIDGEPASDVGSTGLKAKIEDSDTDTGERGDAQHERVWRETTGSHSVFGDKDSPAAFNIDKPAGPKPAELVGIPLKEPGFYVVELESRALGRSLLGRDELRYVATSALVTNMAVHKDQLVDALRRFVNGKLMRRSALATADLTVRKLAAVEALSRFGSADANMLDSIAIEPNLWPTSAVLDWVGILKRVKGVAHEDERRSRALQILRSRLNFQGTTLGFATERGDALWWLMISTDSNANRLLLTVLDLPQWRADIPRLVRGALGRQQNGHWNTTVANAWGVLALGKFSAAFESTPVTGASSVHYGPTVETVTWPRPHDSAEIDLPWQAGTQPLEITHAGTGRPWVIVRARAALPLTQPVSAGFKILRTATPMEQRIAGRWTRGDVVRVKLELEAQSDMSWVVVDDPVPAGASILGSGLGGDLGGDRGLLARGNRREGWAWLAYEERRFDSFRAYYRFIPKGRWSVEYTVRLNNPGRFQLPATRVEAMYAPEMLGEQPNANLLVDPSPP